MQRREFITLLGGAATLPLAARAQQAAIPEIGFLNPGSRHAFADRVDAFHHGLREAGYVDGQNVSIEYRWANGQYDRLPEMATDLVRRRVAVIAALGGIPSALAAKAATTTIPVVFMVASDPVGVGLVASLNRPLGNLTGVTTLALELLPKRMELLHDLVPTATIVAALVNPTGNGAITQSRALQAAARSLGLQFRVLHASSEGDFEPAFAAIKEMGAGALIIGADPFFNTQIERLVALTVRYAIPASYQYREFTVAGGLMSYGVGGSFTDPYHQAGVYVGRVLKGAKPSDLPVLQPTKYELAINLKTAKALGLAVPASLLTTADEVIE